MMKRKVAFTLIELLVVISIIALLIGILLPALGAARRNANMMKNSTQVRSIIQAMLTFANSNKEYLPGRKKGIAVTGINGEVDNGDIFHSADDGHHVNSRYALLVEGAYFGGDIMLSPGDTRDTRWTTGNVNDSPDASAHFSYSMLALGTSNTDGGGRRKVWDGGSISSSSPIMADRPIKATGGVTPKSSKSYWSATSENWKGSVGYGDVHTEFEDDQVLQDTRYSALTCDSDDIFSDSDTGADCDNQNNALMIQTGNDGVASP